MSLLIDTNLSFGPASLVAWPNVLNGDAGTLAKPVEVKRSTSCRLKISGNP